MGQSAWWGDRNIENDFTNVRVMAPWKALSSPPAGPGNMAVGVPLSQILEGRMLFEAAEGTACAKTEAHREDWLRRCRVLCGGAERARWEGPLYRVTCRAQRNADQEARELGRPRDLMSLEPGGVSHPAQSLGEAQLGPLPRLHPHPLGLSPALSLSLLLQHFPLVMDGIFPAWVKSNVS